MCAVHNVAYKSQPLTVSAADASATANARMVEDYVAAAKKVAAAQAAKALAAAAGECVRCSGFGASWEAWCLLWVVLSQS